MGCYTQIFQIYSAALRFPPRVLTSEKDLCALSCFDGDARCYTRLHKRISNQKLKNQVSLVVLQSLSNPWKHLHNALWSIRMQGNTTIQHHRWELFWNWSHVTIRFLFFQSTSQPLSLPAHNLHILDRFHKVPGFGDWQIALADTISHKH